MDYTLWYFFSECPLYQWNIFLVIPQSHMNDIIWHQNFINNNVFLSTFFEKIPFNLPPFYSCLINFSIPKGESFYFGIYSYKASKSRAYGLHPEEANVATVVAMNWRRDNFFLNAELLFLCHSGCSVSNEYIPPGIIIVEVPIPNHSL